MLKIKQQIIDTIKNYRDVYDLSQSELAKKISTRQQAISRIEKDKMNYSIDNISYILDGIGYELVVRKKVR